MPDDASDHEATRRRHAFHALRLQAILDETADTRTLVLDVPDELTDLFRYDAGQFCTVRVHLDGDDVLRCYSMSSAPATDDDLAVTVKRVPGGVMSNWLHDRVVVGDTLELMPPAGQFCARHHDTPVLAFCGGSGVTPVFSIVKQLLATTERSLRVLYANRDADSVIFFDALDALVTAHPERLRLRQHLDDAAGYLGADDIVEFVGTDIDADVYVCGPTPFMDIVEQGLAQAGVPADRILIERFVNAAVLDEAFTEAEPSVGAAPAPAADAAGADTLTIVLKGKRHTMDYVDGDTVLDAARRAALKPPSSCELGNCASCMALVTEGYATMRANNALTPDEVAEGWVLTCQALPDGGAVIEYEDL